MSWQIERSLIVEERRRLVEKHLRRIEAPENRFIRKQRGGPENAGGCGVTQVFVEHALTVGVGSAIGKPRLIAQAVNDG